MSGTWVNWDDGNYHTIATQDTSGTFLTSDSLGNASMKPYLTQAQTSGQTQSFKKLVTQVDFPAGKYGQLQDNQGRCLGKDLKLSTEACGFSSNSQYSFQPFISNEYPNIGYASYKEILGGGKQLFCMNPQGYLQPPDIFT